MISSIKIDPNLEKIKEANMKYISNGNFTKALDHAIDYLRNIHTHDSKKITKEFRQFRTSIKKTYENLSK